MTQNNLLIPISILLAGAMVSFALMVALGGPAANNGLGAAEPAATDGLVTDRTNWSDPDVHAFFASELELDVEELVACFNDGTHREKVTASTVEAQDNGGNGTPYFIINDSPVSGAQPYGVFKQAIDAELEKAESNPDQNNLAAELDGFPSLGDSDAPVTVVEYSDFACPFCKRFHEQTKPQIVEEYVEQGLVRFVRKDFIAVGGDKAAEAAHCAGDQGAYWEYADILMANQ